MSASFFNEEFGLSAMVDIDLSHPTLLCDVLLSSAQPAAAPAAHCDAGPIDMYDPKTDSPDIDALENVVPTDDCENATDSGATSVASSFDFTQVLTPQSATGNSNIGLVQHHGFGGPVAAPLQSFPNVDLTPLRRRAKTEPVMPTTPTPPRRSPPRRARASPVESPSDVVVPTRVSARSGDQRKRRVEEQCARTELEVSEEERLEKNRQSARDCRLRKKRYIESLERRIAEFERRETVLTATIARLEDQMAQIHSQNGGQMAIKAEK